MECGARTAAAASGERGAAAGLERRTQPGGEARPAGAARARAGGTAGGLGRQPRQQSRLARQLPGSVAAARGHADAERVRARDRPEPRRLRPRSERARASSGPRARKLGIVDAAAGEIVAGDLPQLAATNPGLVITPDQPVVLDAKPESKPKNPKEPAHPGGVQLRRGLARRGRRRPALAGPGEPAERALEGPGLDALDRLRRLGHRLEPRRLRRPGARPARHDLAREQLARRRQRPRDARRGPRRRLGAGPRGRRPDRRDRLARRDGRPGHGAHERRDRGRPVDPQEPPRSTTSGSRTSRSTPRPRPASAGTRSTRRSRSSGSRASSSWLPPATRARAASRRRWPTRPRTTRS